MTQATIEKPEVSAVVADQKPKKGRPFWRAALEFAAVFVVCILLLEPILTLAGVVNDEALDVEPVTGWAPMPNRAYTYRKEGFGNSTINSFGMHDRERSLQKPAGTFRIAIMGDSLTEGQQVPMDKNYCALLEKRLNETGTRKYEVLNFGVSGYALGQEYLRMKDLALRFHPDLVIIAARVGGLLYMGPDPKLGFFNARPIFGVTDDGTLLEDRGYQKHWLTTGDGKRMLSTRWLRYHSRTWGIISKCAAQVAVFKATVQAQFKGFIAKAKNLNRANTATTLATAAPSAYVPSTETLNSALIYLGKTADAILRESKKECDKAGCELMLAYLPLKAQVRDPLETQLFEQSAKKHSLKYFDLNPPMDILEKNSKEPFYLVSHYSKEGNKQIANQFFQYLKKAGY